MEVKVRSLKFSSAAPPHPEEPLALPLTTDPPESQWLRAAFPMDESTIRPAKLQELKATGEARTVTPVPGLPHHPADLTAAIGGFASG